LFCEQGPIALFDEKFGNPKLIRKGEWEANEGLGVKLSAAGSKEARQ